MFDAAAYSREGQGRALWLSTIAFTVCFAVWTIFAIIGVRIKDELLPGLEYGDTPKHRALINLNVAYQELRGEPVTTYFGPVQPIGPEKGSGASLGRRGGGPPRGAGPGGPGAPPTPGR